MTDVLDADSVLSILAKRPQPRITRRRRLNPDCKEPRYAVATFQGIWHRKFPLDYSKQFGQRVPDWIWVEHPETIIALSNLAMSEGKLLPDVSPEPSIEQELQELKDLRAALQAELDAVSHVLSEAPVAMSSPEYHDLMHLCTRIYLIDRNLALLAGHQEDRA